jgi:hypothetical protein
MQRNMSLLLLMMLQLLLQLCAHLVTHGSRSLLVWS